MNGNARIINQIQNAKIDGLRSVFDVNKIKVIWMTNVMYQTIEAK